MARTFSRIVAEPISMAAGKLLAVFASQMQRSIPGWFAGRKAIGPTQIAGGGEGGWERGHEPTQRKMRASKAMLLSSEAMANKPAAVHQSDGSAFVLKGFGIRRVNTSTCVGPPVRAVGVIGFELLDMRSKRTKDNNSVHTETCDRMIRERDQVARHFLSEE